MQDGQFSISPNTPFEDLLNAAGVKAPVSNTFDSYNTEPKPSDYYDAFQNQINSISQKKLTPGSVEPVSPFQIDTSGRFNWQRIGADNEDLYAQGQTWADKAANGILKGLALAGTTFVQGTLGLVVGLTEWAATGKFSKVYDNEFSNALNSFTEGLENKLPNYYTAKERDAEWWEPSNLFTANFLFDKIIKNLGFSLGAIYSGGATLKALKALRSVIPIAKDANALEKLGSYLESTLAQIPKAERVGFAANAIRNTSKVVNTLSKVAPTDRTLISALGAFTESGIESLQNTNQYRDARIKEYRDTHGVNPVGQDLEAINNDAADVGNASFMLNATLLTATNYIQLPKILGSSYDANRHTLNNIGRKGVGEALESQVPKRGITKLVSKARNAGSLLFSPTEAFEEASQSAITFGTQAYYDKKRNNIDTDIFDEAYDAYYNVLTTKEGMEQLIIGGFSGAMQQFRGKVKKRGVFGTGGTRAANTAKAISEMEAAGFGQALRTNVDQTRRSITLQSEKAAAAAAGDKLIFEELEFDDAHNYLSSRIKWGKYDFVKEDIAQYRQDAATDEGFEKLREKGIVGEADTKEAFLRRLDNFETHADNVNSLYQSLNTRFGGTTIVDGKPVRKYSDATIEKMVYAAAKVANYDEKISELSTNLLSTTTRGGEIIDVQAVIDDMAQGVEKATLEPYAKELAKLRSVEAVNKDELIEDFESISELSLRRKQFYDEYEDMKANPQNYAEREEKVIAGAEEGMKEAATHKIKTKDGEEDLQEDVEYQVISVSRTKEGAKFFEFPTFKIIGKNEDGTYTIESGTGFRKNVSADFLNDFRVGKAADLAKNKKASFVKKHANKIAYFNFGKKKAAAILGVKESELTSGNVKGRIWYDSKTNTVRFYYVDKYGKARDIIIEGKHYSPKYAKQQGFKWTQLSFGKELTKEEEAEMEDMANIEVDVAKEWDNRLKIVRDLVDETSSRIDVVNKQIEEKKVQLNTVKEELAVIEDKIDRSSPTRKGNFKKTTKAALKSAQRLSRLRDVLQGEISNLENDKVELEQHLEYYFDLHQNISELPTERQDFMDAIKEMRDNLGDAIANTGVAIVETNKVLSNVERALQSALDLAFSLISKFEAKYPGVPTNMRDLISRIELAKENIKKEATLTRPLEVSLDEFAEDVRIAGIGIGDEVYDSLRALEEEIVQLEDLDIIPNERTVKELKDFIESLYKELDDLTKQQKIASSIYDRFDSAFKAQEEEERQRAEVLKNADKLKKIYGNPLDSGDVNTGIPTEDEKKDRENDEFNAAKPVANAASTTDPSGEHGYAPKQDFHKRHEVFLNAFTFLPDDRKKNVRVVLVNADMEADLGLTGLTDRVLGAATEEMRAKKMDPTVGVVTALYVEVDNGTYHILNERGDRIGVLGEKGRERELIDTAVYSTMSAAKTLDSKGRPRYIENQKGESAVVISFLEWYKKLRTKWLGSKSVEANAYQFTVSTGIPRRVEGGTKVSPIGPVITQDDLAVQGLIQVSVNGTLTVNGYSKRYPIGRPVLVKGNSTLILNNRNISKDESENVFQALLNLAGSLNKWNPAVVKWLRNIMFFSDPNSGDQKKIPGRNQIWVADGLLHVGKNDGVNGFAIPFTVADIKQNEKFIRAVIQGAYMNVNNVTLRNNQSFEEIIGWKDGVPQTRTWKSYQHYLLSPTYALDVSLDEAGENGQPRKDEVPLSANIIKPQEGEMQGVFKQRYSTIIPKEDEVYVAPAGQQAPTQPTAAVVTPAAGAVQPKEHIPGYTLDGKTENSLEWKGKKIVFTGVIENGKVMPTILSDDALLADEVAAKADQLADVPVEERAKFLAAAVVRGVLEPLIVKTVPTVVPQTAAVAAVAKPGQRDVSEILAEMEREDADTEGFDENLAMRLINGYNVPRITEEEWKAFEAWMKENLPSVPFKRVGSIIDMGKGNPGAWGMLHNGIIKVFSLAEKGTEYHEAFEAVWRYYVTDEERVALHKEFIKRKGSFIERGSGKVVEYKDATMHQAKEELADEFFDYKTNQKRPPTVEGERRGILKFFVDLWNAIKDWVKSIFTGPTATLFKRINSGYYKNSQPIRSLIGRDYSAITGTTEQLTREMMENISANVAFTLLGDKSSNAFYNISKVGVNELYAQVREFTLREINRNIRALSRLYRDPNTSAFDKGRAEDIIRNADEVKQLILSDVSWKEIKNKNKEFLRQVFKIKVTEEGAQLEEEQKNRNDYARDNFFIDTKQSAPKAIKLLFMTLVEADRRGRMIGETGIPVAAKNSYGGTKLVKSSKAFIDVMKALVNTNTLEGMLGKLYDLSKSNPDYVRLYSRLKGNIDIRGQLNWENLSFDDIRLISDFYVAFSKQAPVPYIVFYKENGEVVFQRADLNSLINNTIGGWISNLRMLARGGNEYITKGRIGKLTSYTINVPKDKIIYTGDIKTVLKTKLLPILSKLGVDIDPNLIGRLSDSELSTLKKAVEDYLSYIGIKNVTSITREATKVGGPMATMAEIVINNSEIEDKMTYFNVENEQQQLYIDDNFFSKLSNTINDVSSLSELKTMHPEYNDIFSSNSLIFKPGGRFFKEDGSRTSTKISVGYLNGVLTKRGPKKVGKLSKSERLLTFINAMVNPRQGGWFPIITPADSSTEYLIQLGRFFEYSDTGSSTFDRKIRTIFSGYLQDEINLAIDVDNRTPNTNRDKRKEDLRFFDGILRDSLKKSIKELVKDGASPAQVREFVTTNIGSVEEDLKKFFKEKADRVRAILESEGKIRLSENADQVVFYGLDSDFARERDNGLTSFSEGEGGDAFTRMSTKQIDNFLMFVVSNHAASVIELHKIAFGDPYQFAIKTDEAGRVILDEAKRAKQSLSPRKSILSGEAINKRLNELMNKVGKVQLQPGEYGYTYFDDTLRTNTISNFMVLGAPTLEGITGYEEVDRSDSQMWMMPTMHREMMLKSGGWSDVAEEFFQWDAAMFRKHWATQDKKWKKEYNKNKALVAQDEAIIKKRKPRDYRADILKPIITGPKEGRMYIDYVTDKMSAFPMYFTNIPKDSHLMHLFIKNFQSKSDYSIVPTGRKVGVEKVYSMYRGGEINPDPIPQEYIFTLPVTNFGIQLETTSDGTTKVTRGTQATKEVTLDLLDNGVPVDYKGKEWNTLDEAERESVSSIYKEIKHNERLLNALTDHGYSQLLEELGVVDTGERFILSNPKDLEETLLKEVFRKDSNDNIIDSVKFNPTTGRFNINFEASANYQSIKNILLSVVDKNVVSQKMNGGAKIQLSSALFDTNETISPYIKREKAWVKLSKEEYEALSEKDKSRVRLFSTKLKFYSKNKDGSVQRAQVLLPHWFGQRIRDSKLLRNASDEEILKMLNFTEEGRKILQGVGFRIPTQGHNFMDAFEVVGFLPQAAGDTIVLPAEITTKSGTDFDVDKLNVYLRNIYVDHRQEIKLVPFFGIGEDAKEKIKRFLLENDIGYLFPTQEEIFDIYAESSEDVGLQSKNSEFFEKSEVEAKKKMLPNFYKESLENEYIASFERLLLHPLNYERLVTPNSNNGMEKLRDKLLEAVGTKEIEEARDISVLLSLSWMNMQRHNVITAKELIGVGALGITHQSLTQRAQVVIDPERINNTYSEDKPFLGNGQIALSHNTVVKGGKRYATMSSVYDQKGQAISKKMSAYTNGFVDAVKDPFLAEMGVDRQTGGTFTFLERVGVPTETVIWFMNQPIIREYLKIVYTAGSTYLYSKQNIEAALGMFGGKVGEALNEKNLFSNIEDYYSGKKFDEQRNAEQGFILMEFLKYSKMGNHLREFQQATNWDTANFSDFTHSMIKSAVYENAKAHNIFGDPAQVLDNSFLGNMREKILGGNLSLSAILKFQHPAVQAVLAKVLYPMINPRENYVSDRDAIKLGNSVVSSFIDYIVQTLHQENSITLNSLINRLLVGPNSVAREVQKIKNDTSNPLNKNYAFQRLSTLIGDQEGEVDNLVNKLTDKDIFSQNQFISALAEIKETNEPLYRRMVMASILQSGVKKSPISFTDLIPLEDYASILNPIVESLIERNDFQPFAQNSLFQRNNWGNKNLVPQVAWMAKSKAGSWYRPLEVSSYRYGKAVEALEARIGKNTPLSLPIAMNMNSKEAGSDIITVRRDNIGFTAQQIAEMQARGDWGYKITVGYQKVKDAAGNSLIISQQGKDGTVYYKFVYKPINLYGDGIYLQEYYNDTRKSAVDNGTYKVDFELDNATIIDAFKYDTTFGVPSGYTPALGSVVATPIVASTTPVKKSGIIFTEEQESGYKARTRKNASRDVTIAIASDFSTAGEKLTKSSVESQKKLYLPVSIETLTYKSLTDESIRGIVNKIKSLGKKEITLNIAGNGIYTISKDFSQAAIDSYVYSFMSSILEQLNREGIIVTEIVTGGQTGVDEAGAKAGFKLGVPTTVNAPKGWVYRDISGTDVYDERRFKARFGIFSGDPNDAHEKAIDDLGGEITPEEGTEGTC